MQAIHGTGLLQRSGVQTLAVFRALQLGDMLCAVPALRALRAASPDAWITLIGLPWAQQFVERFSAYIDDFLAFPGHPAFPEQPVHEESVPAFYETTQRSKFDLVLQLHGSGEVSNRIAARFGARAVAGYMPSGSSRDISGHFLAYQEQGPEPLRLLRLVAFLGAPSCGTHLEFPLTAQDERELADRRLGADLTPGGYICIHPGARMHDKCWPTQCFAEVADRLADEFGLKVVLTGSAKEADLTAAVAAHMRHKAIDAAASISIGAMAALMSRARLLVCNDTGVSHIAAGLRLPSVVVFSKADMQRWSPLDNTLHACVWDPEGKQVAVVLEHARRRLAGA